MSAPSITVVVPTRGRPQALRRCLAALARQSRECEVVVVEDAPAPSPATRAAAAWLHARVTATGGRGPAAARNAGAAAARGDVVCFTDDDCEPRPEWAELLASACADGGAAAGQTVNARPRDALAAASQLITSQLQRSSLRSDGTLGFAPTSNLAAAAGLARALPFDASFSDAAAEDREWCARAERHGARPRFVPAAVVEHRQELSWRGFGRQQWRYGRGAALLQRSGVPLARPRARLQLARAALRAGPAVAALVVAAQLVVALGFVWERLVSRSATALRRARRGRRR